MSTFESKSVQSLGRDAPSRVGALAAASTLACVGCVETSVTRTGERFPPFPKTCAIDFQYGDFNKAMQHTASGYVQVASMFVAHAGDTIDESMKERVRPEACKVGAHVAMLVSSHGGTLRTCRSCFSGRNKERRGVACPA